MIWDMKYDNIKAFEKHLESASPNHFSEIYLLLSKDPFDGKEALDLLLKHLLPNPMALTTIEGSSANHLLNELNSMSFFAQKRVVLVQQADKLNKSIQESLDQYLASPNRAVHLILAAPSLLKTTTFYKKIEKAGIVLEIVELKPWEKEKKLAEWVGKKAAASRIVISHPVCQLLVRASGVDSSLLATEWEKLLCYIGERKEITHKDVEAICTQADSQTIWQLGEAIFRFDAAAALSICHTMLEEGQPLLPLLRQIRSQFQTGFQISLLAQGGQIGEIAKEYPYMKGQILDKNIQQAKNYGSEKYKLGLMAIDAAEMQTKNSQLEDFLIAELLIIQLSSRQPYVR